MVCVEVRVTSVVHPVNAVIDSDEHQQMHGQQVQQQEGPPRVGGHHCHCSVVYNAVSYRQLIKLPILLQYMRELHEWVHLVFIETVVAILHPTLFLVPIDGMAVGWEQVATHSSVHRFTTDSHRLVCTH